MRKNYANRSLKDDSSITYVYTAFITLRDGTRLYAKERGLKAFRIPIQEDKR